MKKWFFRNLDNLKIINKRIFKLSLYILCENDYKFNIIKWYNYKILYIYDIKIIIYDIILNYLW